MRLVFPVEDMFGLSTMSCEVDREIDLLTVRVITVLMKVVSVDKLRSILVIGNISCMSRSKIWETRCVVGAVIL